MTYLDGVLTIQSTFCAQVQKQSKQLVRKSSKPSLPFGTTASQISDCDDNMTTLFDQMQQQQTFN